MEKPVLSNPEQISSSTSRLQFSKNHLILLGLLLILLAGLIGFLLGKNLSLPKPIAFPAPQPFPSAIPTSVIIDPTVNWKTYANSINQYTLKIPQDWVVEDRQGVFLNIPGEVTFTPTSEITIKEPVFRTKLAIIALKTEKIRYSLNTQDQLDEWLNKNPASSQDEVLYKIGNAELDELPALKFVSKSYPGAATGKFFSIVTWLRKDGINYYFELGGDENKVNQLIPDYDLVLSSFKFQDLSLNNPGANWKVFGDERFHFQINYPQDFELKPGLWVEDQDAYSDLGGFYNAKTTILLRSISNIDIYQGSSPKKVAEREIMDAGYLYETTEKMINNYSAALTVLESFEVKIPAGIQIMIATIAHPSENLFLEIKCDGNCQQFDQILSTFKFLD